MFDENDETLLEVSSFLSASEKFLFRSYVFLPCLPEATSHATSSDARELTVGDQDCVFVSVLQCGVSFVFPQAFVIFCGLGMHNTMMYDQMAKAKAKQQVALEVSHPWIVGERGRGFHRRFPEIMRVFICLIINSALTINRDTQ